MKKIAAYKNSSGKIYEDQKECKHSEALLKFYSLIRDFTYCGEFSPDDFLNHIKSNPSDSDIIKSLF